MSTKKLDDKQRQLDDKQGLHEQDMILTPKEAEAASPEELSVCGEEDPGVGLESLVEKHQVKEE